MDEPTNATTTALSPAAGSLAGGRRRRGARYYPFRGSHARFPPGLTGKATALPAFNP